MTREPIRLYAPILKSNIDIARRIVKGIAQVESDAPDHQNDIVSFDASKRAFANWLGNVREMHGKKAVGKCLEWHADPVKKAITVSVKISKGAEDTWQKVLDGTLAAFSIGGHENESERRLSKSTGKTYKYITDYALSELSLVDSPAHPECIVTAIVKNRNGQFATDVLEPLHGGSIQKMALNKAHVALNTVAKALGDKDEILVIRKSDVEFKNGVLVLKGDAVPGVISKEEAADAGLMDDSDKTTGNDMGGIDLEQHATNMAKAHKDLSHMAGIDDDEAHYKKATAEPGEGDMGGNSGDIAGGASGGTPSEMAMARRAGNLRKGADLDKLIEKAVGDKLGAITASIEAIRSALGGGALAPRNESGEPGEPIKKTLQLVMGDPMKKSASDGSMEKRYADLEAEYAPMKKRQGELIAKREARFKLTPEEEIEAQRLAKDMGRIEVAQSEMRKQAANL